MTGPGAGRPLRAYLSATTVRLDELRAYARELRECGVEVLSSWLQAPGERPPVEAARADLNDLRRADVLVAFTQGPGAAHQGRGARHVELGVALERRLRVIVVGEREHVFHELPVVEHATDWAQARYLLCRVNVPRDSTEPWS